MVANGSDGERVAFAGGGVSQAVCVLMKQQHASNNSL